MRVVISVDMEGASGIVSRKQCTENSPQWHEARHLLAGDVNAAIEGAMSAGATEFVLHDSHGLDFVNLPMAELHPNAQVVYGQPVLLYEQLEDGAALDGGYACAFLVGYHAGPGKAAILSHLFTWPKIQEVRLNGRYTGEGGVAAALAGAHGIPTTLVTGDDATGDEMQEWCPDIETAVVKYSLSRYAGRCLPLGEARSRIREAAQRAVARRREHRLPDFGAPGAPVTLEVRLASEQLARLVSLMPHVERQGADWIRYHAPDVLAAYRCLCAVLVMVKSTLAPYQAD
ncbi:MAG: M55 family metallopeptidase [Chloroflexota bacterium]|nr:M55 family metallopeptidase [Chloroflexota bacterium]